VEPQRLRQLFLNVLASIGVIQVIAPVLTNDDLGKELFLVVVRPELQAPDDARCVQISRKNWYPKQN